MMTKEEIKTLRKSLGLTQAEFAVAVGTSKRTVQNWESGESAPLAVYQEKLEKLKKEKPSN